jgi:hypothetical protein
MDVFDSMTIIMLHHYKAILKLNARNVFIFLMALIINSMAFFGIASAFYQLRSPNVIFHDRLRYINSPGTWHII